jgi:putative ABC transport system permease protein
MLANYFKIAMRNLLKNKVHSLINVLGLAFGIASVFLMTLYITVELSYDKFHHQPEDIYRIVWEDDHPQTRTPHPMAQAMVADFPEVESAVSLSPLFAAGLTRETHSIRHPGKEERYDETNILAVDTTFFQVFDFPLVKGDPRTALKKINGVLISESMARKYFGTEDPIGKNLAIDSTNYLVEVTAVFKDVPVNSHFHFDFLASYIREKSFNPASPFYGWSDFGHYNYIRLRHGADAKALEAKILPWVKDFLNPSEEDYRAVVANNFGFRLQPITDIHLHSKLHWELEPNGNMEYIYILGAAALFTLIIACVNFMNLTTAKSAERAKEIGVRKTMGAFRSQLSVQFLTESVLVALSAVLIAIFIIEVSLPFFNYLTGLQIEVQYTHYLFILCAAAILIGLVSGLYPAIYLSGVQPHLILKGRFAQSPRGSMLRKSLIVVQFSISMILISAAIIIYSQLNYIRHTNLGFNRDEVILIKVKNEDGWSRFDAFRNEMLNVDGVSAVSAASNIPGQPYNQHAISLAEVPDNIINSSEAYVDYDFLALLNIEMAEGRTFLRENPGDFDAYIINETAARQLDPNKSVIGRELVWDPRGTAIRGKIIGVVEDFHFQSLHQPIRPLLFSLSSRDFNYLMVKVNTTNFAEKIDGIRSVYDQFETIFGFEFTFLDNQLSEQYVAEERTATVLGLFSFIALLIACFGLFGMAMLLFYQKIKEIGVRKVLGASSYSLLVLLLGNFTKLIVIAIVIATPVSWYVMRGWLANFNYKIDIQPGAFVISGASLLVLAWTTLSYFTLKATQLNPAEVLKNE